MRYRYNDAMNKEFLSSHTNKPAIRAYLGGSFNPVHLGHIKMAMAVYNTLAPIATEQNRVLKVSLLPNARSPFKTQSTDPADRLAMLQLATQNTPLQIDELEVWQEPPVYSIDSVRTLRKRYPNDCLIFIMGMDSARSLDKWKDGLQLTDYVHLWIFNRESSEQAEQSKISLTAELPLALQSQVVGDSAELLCTTTNPINQSFINQSSVSKTSHIAPLKDTPKGRIYIDTQAVLTVSSTQIRKHFAKANYQSLSSTLCADMPVNNLADWLNPKVYHYIITHQLYSAA